jgi:hypothetical protein
VNVYQVIISQYCRKEPKKILDFVVKSGNTIDDVQAYYYKRYYGLHVQIIEITEIKTVELPNELPKPEAGTVEPIAKKTTIIRSNIELTEAERSLSRKIIQLQQELEENMRVLSIGVENRLRKEYCGIISNVSAETKITGERHYMSSNVNAVITLKGAVSDGLKLFEQKPAEIE